MGAVFSVFVCLQGPATYLHVFLDAVSFFLPTSNCPGRINPTGKSASMLKHHIGQVKWHKATGGPPAAKPRDSKPFLPGAVGTSSPSALGQMEYGVSESTRLSRSHWGLYSPFHLEETRPSVSFASRAFPRIKLLAQSRTGTASAKAIEGMQLFPAEPRA